MIRTDSLRSFDLYQSDTECVSVLRGVYQVINPLSISVLSNPNGLGLDISTMSGKKEVLSYHRGYTDLSISLDSTDEGMDMEISP
jgi:hypothetical protein